MVIVIGFALLAALVTWFYWVTNPRPNASMGTSSAAAPMLPDGLSVAFIASGKLFCKSGNGAVQQISSPYIQDIEDRLARSKERNAWKENTSFQVSASGQMKQFANDGANIAVTSALFHQERSVLYFLRDQGIGGLFSYDLDSGVETRILHKQYLDLTDLNLDATGSKILCAAAGKDGASNIASLDIDGNRMRELTGGDTVDSAPAWVPGDEHAVLYQSAGLARNPGGYVIAQGNISIQKLNLRTGSVEAVLDAPQFDFLHPRVNADGKLHFIRRPYETPQYSSGNILLDTLLFPFRLLRALFHYLNFFSLMYSRKPLTGAAGPAVQADIKDIILKGRRIDAEKALREESQINGIASLVPRSWELVCRNRDGSERVLATNVASYDLMDDGSIVYSNGRAVFMLGAGTQSTLVLKDDLVGDVAARMNAR
ncbi:MAG: hypothetical protein V4484_00150 [Pseudomonadota bacterium]